MNVVSLQPRPMNYSRAGAPPAAPPPADEEKTSGVASVLGRGVATVAGAGVGYVGAQMASATAQTAGSFMTQVLVSSMPKMNLQPVLPLLNNVFGLSIGGSALLAVGAGMLAGAVVAYHAAAGAEKVDDALRAGQLAELTEKGGKQGRVSAYFQELHDYGAEMRSSLKDVNSADSLKGAIGAGFCAGASLGAPVGAAAGKVQGLGFGIALGVLGSLPIVASVPGPLGLPLMVGFGLLGGAMGAKLGEPVGNLTGSIVAGGVGALLGGAYHGIKSLLGGGQESAAPAPAPPAAQPPAAQPPAEQPPAAQPPAEQPPAAQPPAA